MGEFSDEAAAEAAVELVVGEAIEAGFLVGHGGRDEDLGVGGEGVGVVLRGNGEDPEVVSGAAELVKGRVEHVEAVSQGGALPVREVGIGGGEAVDMEDGAVDGGGGEVEGGKDDVSVRRDGAKKRGGGGDGREAEGGVAGGTAGCVKDDMRGGNGGGTAGGNGGDSGDEGKEEKKRDEEDEQLAPTLLEAVQ